MKFCKKCKEKIDINTKTYHGLCPKCYKNYLLEKINNIGKPNKHTKK